MHDCMTVKRTSGGRTRPASVNDGIIHCMKVHACSSQKTQHDPTQVCHANDLRCKAEKIAVRLSTATFLMLNSCCDAKAALRS